MAMLTDLLRPLLSGSAANHRAKYENLCRLAAIACCMSTATACSGVDDYPASSAHGGASSALSGGASNAGGAVLNAGGSNASAGVAGAIGNGGTTGAGGTLGTTSGGTAPGSIAGAGSASGGSASGAAGGNSNKGGSTSLGGNQAGGRAGQGGALTGGVGSGGKTEAGGQMNSGGVAGGNTTNSAYLQVQTVIEKKCGICHTLGGNQPDLTTTGTELYDTLATFRVRQCGGNPMVSPNNPAQSALLMVTNGKCSGLRMPQGCSGTSCVTSQEQQTISGWIAEGAKH